MLNSTKLPNSFWAEELVTAVYLSNISTTHDVNNKTPHEAQYGVKPKVTHLKVFGCVAYTNLPTQTLQKLDRRALKGIFVGYYTNAKTYL